MPESYIMIRGQQYVTEVIAVGEDVKLVEKGDVAVVITYLDIT
jgi:fructose-1,6-bisphosphatase/sedoheptulose 1,7-bisphosphatase-like protein